MAYVAIPETDLDANSGLVESTTLQITRNLVAHEASISDLEAYMGAESWTAKTSDYTLVTNDVNGNYGFNNDGASGTVIFTLPAALVGMRVTIINVESQTVNIKANGSELIYMEEAAGEGNGEVISTTKGDVMILWCPVAGEWYAMNNGAFLSSGRAVFFGGRASGGGAYTNTAEYVEIPTTSSAIDFGDLTDSNASAGGCASASRGIRGGGESGPVNIMDYNTIQTTGNFVDFGDLTSARYALGCTSSSTRGLFMGGFAGGELDDINQIVIATTANASSAGSLLSATRYYLGGVCNGTRAIMGGGNPTINIIEYVTVESLASAVDFGDLTAGRVGVGTGDNSIRGLFAGGSTGSLVTTIDGIVMATTGNASDDGDLSQARAYLDGTSNSSRAVFAGGYSTLPNTATDTIDYVGLAGVGTATDFGNLSSSVKSIAGHSDAHGGLNG